MAYFAPYIDENGLHIPTYDDVVSELVSRMKAIFGNDIYLEDDSMDYQQISIFARKIHDTYMLAQLVYNNRTPVTAVGVGLDNVVAFAGIQRKPASNSTVIVTLTGDAGTVITNGQVQGDDGVIWDLPETVTIPGNGIVSVTATAEDEGNIGALPNTITQIITPVYGWTSVTNNNAAEPGKNVETDASLRGRFGVATRKQAQTVFESMLSSIANISGVTRVRGYENDTAVTSDGTTPPNTPAGLPNHSVTFVVEGGQDAMVAEAIYNSKGPGVYTNGTTEVQLTTETGNINTIRFYRPTYKEVYIRITIKKFQNYNDEYVDTIKQDIVQYVSEMQLAENLYRSIVWSVATSSMGDIKNPAYSVLNVEFSDDGNTYNTNDVTVQFFEAVQVSATDIEVVVQ